MSTRFFVHRLIVLFFVAALAVIASGCEATYGVGVSVGYPYGGYAHYGGGGLSGPGWYGGPVVY